ncbi:hypothetical protein [Peijinzhouia sedimentorum]
MKLKKLIKEKWAFVRLVCKAIFSDNAGWVFFRLPSKDQKALIEGTDVEFDFHYIKMDGRIIELFRQRLAPKEAAELNYLFDDYMPFEIFERYCKQYPFLLKLSAAGKKEAFKQIHLFESGRIAVPTNLIFEQCKEL